MAFKSNGLGCRDYHIGTFNFAQCREVLEHCRPHINNAMSKLKD